MIEHNQVLQEIILHARSNKKTLHLTFFDLEDAFGSVQHNLIEHCLKRYKIPSQISDYIINLYKTLNGTVVTKSWTSENFKFNKGVFQGDPLSPIIFLIIFNPIIERLQQELKFGYQLKDKSYITTPFADDFNIITGNKRSHQRIINLINECCKTMGLKLKPSKCRSLSIVSGCSTDIPFFIDKDEVSTLTKDPHKFLGATITFSGKQSDIFKLVSDYFQTRLNSIDSLLIRGEFKLKMYQDYLLPASRFMLTVHTISSTNLDRIDALTRKYLKKWMKLPPSATAAVLHSPNFTSIKTVRHLYQESQACAYVSSRLKADALVNTALDSRLEREKTWTRKKSIIVENENILKKIKNKEDLTKAKKETKSIIRNEIKEKWNDKVKSLTLQGQFLEILESSRSDINWKSLMHNLPRNILQFFLNCAIDTLPTNSNLVRWNKRSSPACNLCRNKETLLHTLNNCTVMLNQGRYSWRHNSVLMKLYESLKPHLPESAKIFCDLPGLMTGVSTIPTDILITLLRPDLVIVDYNEKTMSIVELTIPFDSNIESANNRKIKKYENLISDIENEGLSVRFFAFEISSRGYISPDNQKRLKQIMTLTDSFTHKMLNSLKLSLQKIVLVCSYCTFYSKYDSEWIEPQFVHF